MGIQRKTILTDIQRRIQSIVIPYFSFGCLLLIYWQLIEKRFRSSDISFENSLLGLFSGNYDKLDFNVHLWFLPCFFVTVVLFNILVNICGKRIAYIVCIFMSLIYVVLPMPELFWGFNRVFKYIGFYAIGTFLAKKVARKVIDKRLRTGIIAGILVVVNLLLSYLNLTKGIMWYITALIGVAGVILISRLINENKILQYLGQISLIILCIHGPIYRIVVKVISIPTHLSTDAVRENFLLVILVVAITLAVCSVAYEIVVRIFPWMVGKKR